MERLTERGSNGYAYYTTCINRCYSDDCDHCPELEKQCEALAAYEDTGLTPEEINDLKSGKSVPQWISVKDRLPDNDGTYIVAIKNDDDAIVQPALKFGGMWHWSRGKGTVTHWMPLPDLPKEEDKLNDRNLLAISIKHTEFRWKFGMPCWLWGARTENSAPRSFAGYTLFPENAELYSLKDFKEKYGNCDIKCDEPVKMEIGFCKKYKSYDTVLVTYDDYLTYCKAANIPLRRSEEGGRR